MSFVDPNMLYASSHEWIEASGDIRRVGISDHAQEELTDVVFVELPEVGAQFSKGDVIAVVESVKAASDIYSPVSGEVVEINEALQSDPALINTSPYEQGWLFKLKPSDEGDFSSLLTAAAYEESI